jgi:hypothetical protein
MSAIVFIAMPMVPQLGSYSQEFYELALLAGMDYNSKLKLK